MSKTRYTRPTKYKTGTIMYDPNTEKITIIYDETPYKQTQFELTQSLRDLIMEWYL